MLSLSGGILRCADGNTNKLQPPAQAALGCTAFRRCKAPQKPGHSGILDRRTIDTIIPGPVAYACRGTVCANSVERDFAMTPGNAGLTTCGETACESLSTTTRLIVAHGDSLFGNHLGAVRRARHHARPCRRALHADRADRHAAGRRAAVCRSRDRSALFYALLLKDLGCSSNAAKMTYLFGADDHLVKRIGAADRLDQARSSASSTAGATAARRIDGREAAARWPPWLRSGAEGARKISEVRCERGRRHRPHAATCPRPRPRRSCDLDEHWNGQGHPCGLQGRRDLAAGPDLLPGPNGRSVLHRLRPGGRASTWPSSGAASGSIRNWSTPAGHSSSDSAFWSRLLSERPARAS